MYVQTIKKQEKQDPSGMKMFHELSGMNSPWLYLVSSLRNVPKLIEWSSFPSKHIIFLPKLSMGHKN